jgi:hypothetical protein
MFNVDVDNLDSDFNFDPARKNDLVALDETIRSSAPSLKRFKKTGYGSSIIQADPEKRCPGRLSGLPCRKTISASTFRSPSAISLSSSACCPIAPLRQLTVG